jgi:hypothetical protein
MNPGWLFIFCICSEVVMIGLPVVTQAPDPPLAAGDEVNIRRVREAKSMSGR